MDRVGLLTILALPLVSFTSGWISGTAQAGLVINDKQARKAIENDPDVLTADEAPVTPSQTAVDPQAQPLRPFRPQSRAKVRVTKTKKSRPAEKLATLPTESKKTSGSSTPAPAAAAVSEETLVSSNTTAPTAAAAAIADELASDSISMKTEPVARAPRNLQAASSAPTRSDAVRPAARVATGPSLNELQLRRISQASAQRPRLYAEASAKPAAKPSASPKASPKMETQVIGEEPATRTKKKASIPTEDVSSAEESEPSVAHDEPNAAFAYTHLLPSPMNIPGGTLIVGSNVTWGVTDFLQVSTNILRDATRYWNAQAKVPLIEFPTFIASAWVGWDTFNLNNYDESNPDLRVTSWQPGIVTGYEIGTDMALFVGGNFLATSTSVPKEGIRTSGFARGAQLEVDWSWLYNPAGTRLGDNALSAGVNYDFTYKHLGFGITHHWPSFQFGLHYVVNADRYRVLPIVNLSVGFAL